MKTVVITGASSGLGYSLSEKFLSQGYKVVGVCRSKSNLDIKHISTDFTAKESIEKSLLELHKLENIDVFVCCAGIGEIEFLNEIDLEKSKEVFDVNVSAQNYLISQLSEKLNQNKSDLIILGATIGFKANKFMPFYSMTKWMIRGMLENWREFFKGTSVRVIGIHPGGLETQSNIGPGGREEKISKITGMKTPKLMEPKDIADFIYHTTQVPKNIEISEVIINRK